MDGNRNVCGLLVGKPEERRPLGRPRCRWVDNIRMDLGDIRWGGVDWMVWLGRVLVNAVMNLRVP
jgi:hypothetical protein